MPNPAAIEQTMSAIRAIANGRPVRLTALANNGMTHAQVRAAVASGQLIALRRGIFLPSHDWQASSPEQRHRLACIAATLAYPSAVVSHDSAIRLHGLPTYGRSAIAPDNPCVHLINTGTSRREPGLTLHGGAVLDSDIGITDLMRVTTVLRTTIDSLLSTTDDATGIVLADAALRTHLASRGSRSGLRHRVIDPTHRASARRDLLAQLDQRGSVVGGRRAQAVIDFADPAAESPLESLARLRLARAGLPVPACGMPVIGDDGVTYWVDMLWETERIIGELDGAVKYTDRSVLLQEKRRQDALVGRGYRFIRAGWQDVVNEPGLFVARLRSTFARAA